MRGGIQAWVKAQFGGDPPRAVLRQPAVWLFALLVGIGVGYVAIAFFLALTFLERNLLGALPGLMAERPWWVYLALPTGGGLVTGLALVRLLPDRRPPGIPDLIEARAVGDGRMAVGPALLGGALAILSLGSGASAGREGPIAHLGGALGSGLARALHLPPELTRTLLGAGVAAAVSASFNAPIAGVLFALEVVLRHYALRAFGPIVIASAAAAVVSRVHLGPYPAFVMPPMHLVSNGEYGAVFVLGLVAAVVAIAFVQLVKTFESLAARLDPPLWLRPAAAGLLVGLIALACPQVLGVGYGTADAVLRDQVALGALVGILAAKIVATAVTLTGRFASGVFSPSLLIGACVGAIFGHVLAAFAPAEVSSPSFYAVVGMGAVAAAVLGAPISTALIAFELTRDYETALALLIAVSVASVLARSVLGHSIFLWQLERRGIDVREGFHRTHLQRVRVYDFMRPPPDGEARALAEDEPHLARTDTLGRALALLDEGKLDNVPVVGHGETARVVGIVSYMDALRAYNRALVEADIEEHR
ncbi:MAG: chloride channel protein [Alphaproteobacteria bacterium]|nr:chloride channel protein [Alphaproteobacteria bacterium]